MKKIISILLAVMLLCSLSAVAFATDPSVSNPVAGGKAKDNGLELISATDADGKDCKALIIVTPYLDRGKLNDDAKTEIEKANKSLKDAKPLADINAELKEAAGDKDIIVGDLFDIRAVAEVKYPVKVVIRDFNLDNFLALVAYKDGAWSWVDAEASGDELSFTLEGPGPYAIILDGGAATSAQTGESASVGFIVAAAVFAIAAGYFFTKSRKVKA